MAEKALIAAFLALLVAVPLAQWISEARHGEPPSVLRILTTRPSPANFQAFEKQLEDSSITARTLRPWVQAIQFLVLRHGGEKTLRGRGDWLFYQPGIAAITRRTSPSDSTVEQALAAVAHFRDALAARGIRLVVMPAPNKESVYPDQLATPSRSPGPIMPNPHTRRFLEGCATKGIEVIDLFAVFRSARAEPASVPLYLTQDSHWSPAGMERAAGAAAARLQGHAIGTSHIAPVVVRRHGDLIRMLRSPPLEARLPPEEILCRRVIEPGSTVPYRDATHAGVLVLGDSFLRVYQEDEPGQAGFVAHLAHRLGQPVASIISDGGASTLVRQELHRRPQLLAGARVVLWEFVERDLQLGTEGWQLVPIPDIPVPSEDSLSPSAPAGP